MQVTDVYSEVCYICRILAITEYAFSWKNPSTILDKNDTGVKCFVHCDSLKEMNHYMAINEKQIVCILSQ